MRILSAFFLLFTVLCVVSTATAQRFAVQSGDWTTAIWASTVGGVPGSASVPTSLDDVTINPNVTVTVNSPLASCNAISFGDSTGRLSMGTGSILNVYGNFSLATPTQNAFTSWASGAKIRFTGSAPQVLNGWSTSTTGVSTTFMEMVVDKSADTLRTAGGDRKYNIGTSLEIVNGTFVQASTDDIQGRTLDGTGATTPTITVQAGGNFVMVGGASHMRSGTAGLNPIGKLTVFGKGTFATTSTNRINIKGIDIEDGGSLAMESFSTSNPGLVNADTVRVKSGGILLAGSTTQFWNASVVVIMSPNSVYKVTTATTVYPPVHNFTTTGTVRYQRTAGDGSQTIVDINYNRLEISFAGTKTWTLGGPRVVADSLEVNNSGTLALTASSPQTLTVNGTVRLTSGTIDNSNANATLVLANGAVISRARAVITNAPQFGTTVNVRYTSTTSSVTTGPELPTSATTLNDLGIFTDTLTVTLGTNATVNGTLTLSSGTLISGTSTLTLANNANIRRATGILDQTPIFAGLVNVAYISVVGSVVTGNELPVSTTALDTLSIQSPLNVTLGATVRVNGALDLVRGLFYLGPNNMTLSPAATITGGPADTAMVVTNGSGELRKEVTAPGIYSFPVGDSSGIAEYSPATINLTTGVFSNAFVGAKVVNAKHPNNASATHFINRYWSVTQSGISGFSAGLTFKYTDSDVQGLESSIYLGQWNGSQWSRLDPANATTNELTGTVTSFSDFTGGDENSVTEVVAQSTDVPAEFSLAQNYPNPFNPSTKIRFGLPVRSNVTLVVYNLLGQQVASVVNQQLDAGYHTVEWKPVLASGVYFYQLNAVTQDNAKNVFSSVQKMVLTK